MSDYVLACKIIKKKVNNVIWAKKYEKKGKFRQKTDKHRPFLGVFSTGRVDSGIYHQPDIVDDQTTMSLLMKHHLYQKPHPV